MQDRTRQNKKLTATRSVHPLAGGFIAMHHRTLLDLGLNGGDLLDGTLPSSLGDLVDRTFAELHFVQVRQGILRAFIAHVLLLPIVHHRRFQPGTKTPFHLQPCGWFTGLFLTAAGAPIALPHRWDQTNLLRR